MATPSQEAIGTFMSITGASESTALQKLEEHHGDLNAAINAHFSEGDRSNVRETSVVPSQADLMDIDDPIEAAPRRNPLSLLSESSIMNPFSLLDPHFHRGVFDGGSDFSSPAPFVSHPRERREIPIEVKDGSDVSGNSGQAPVIEDVTGTEHAQDPGIRGTVVIDEDDNDDDFPTELTGRDVPRRNTTPSAPEFDPRDYGNDIEEEMIRAAIEASKLEAQALEQEKVELGTSVMSNGRLRSRDESEDVEEQQPLVRHRSRHTSSGSMESIREFGVIEDSPPSSPRQNNNSTPVPNNGTAFPSDEWGGISSLEHDEAVMLEAAMFGGIPERSGYQFPYAPHQFMQTEGSSYPRPAPRPPSPSLQAQRLIREQQDDEYLASLEADREKEMKAMEEAEARRLQEEAAREAAVEEEKRKERESLRKLEEEQELERELAVKEASLPQEPEPNDENAVTLLVRMPDGTRRGRRFLKSNNLKSLFDFIDIGRAVKPGSYRLVRPYPRRTFSDEDNSLTLSELGLTSKQEALFLELI